MRRCREGIGRRRRTEGAAGGDRRGILRATFSPRLSRGRADFPAEHAATQLASTFEVSLFLQRLTIASPAYEPIYFRYPRDRESLPRSSAAGFEHPAAIWVDFGTVLRGSALGDAPPSTVFHAVPLHRLTASPSDLDVSDVFLDHADQMRLRSARGELLVASTCRKMRPERRRF